MAGTGANSVPLGPLHPAFRGQKSGGSGSGSGESMLNAARLAAARVTANLKPNPNLQPVEVKPERPSAAAYRPFPDAGGNKVERHIHFLIIKTGVGLEKGLILGFTLEVSAYLVLGGLVLVTVVP